MKFAKSTALMLLLPLLPACQQKMADQPNVRRPLRPSAFFSDGRSARPLEADTIARGQLPDETSTGREGDEYVTVFPFEVDDAVLKRGRQRFDIYCAVCHDHAGTGFGKIVERGFTRPPNFHTDLSRGFKLRGKDLSLREVPVGYVFEVISNGFGAMPDYASQVPPRDRWAIVAHVRVLQLSQHFPQGRLSGDEQAKIPPGGAP
ncbi:MAG: c-type cytochrome [Gemmataceae bacterium]